MRNALVCLLLCSPLVAASMDQHGNDDSPIYEGTWNVRLEPGRAARLRVRNWEGAWQETGPRSRSANAACHGKKFPITVQRSTPSGFEFTAWGSAVAPACPDIAFSLEPVDARTLKGATGSGVEVTMTRASGK